MSKFFKILSACMLMVLTYSCSNESILDTPQQVNNDRSQLTRATGSSSWSYVYVLSEGVWHEAGNSEPGAITLWEKGTSDYTLKKTIFVGDTGNDMLLIGDKIYCAVSGHDLNSNDGKILIFDTTGNNLILQDSIIITDPVDTLRRGMPRHLATDDSRLYVSLYSGAVASVNLSNYSDIKTATLTGTYSEGICIVGSDLYICNSGRPGDTQAGNGNTISVLSKELTGTEISIEIPMNPKDIKLDANGDIYFNVLGEYAMNAALYKLEDRTCTSVMSKVSGFDIDKEQQAIYTVDMDWSTYTTIMKKWDIEAQQESVFATDPGYMFGFSVTIAPDGKVCYGQTMSDMLYIFDNAGAAEPTYKTLATNVQNVNKAVFK